MHFEDENDSALIGLAKQVVLFYASEPILKY